jgi:hypothetical protein
MKLSNKVLLGFLGFIFLYITAAFAELRLTGSPNIFDDDNSTAETVDISGISFVILKDLTINIKVIGSDSSKLEVRSLSGGLLKQLKYEVSGDTLTLAGFQEEGSESVRISVFVPQTSLRGIIIKNATANIEDFQQPLLRISQSSGRIWMSSNRIAKIQMEVSNHSFLDISGTSVDTLSATIDRSEVHINSSVGVLQGSMKNDAYLRLNEIKDIHLKKDESSRLNVYE